MSSNVITNGMMRRYVAEASDEWGKTRMAAHFMQWCERNNKDSDDPKSVEEWEKEPFRIMELPKVTCDELDPCYECSGYGDDYSIDDNGDLVLNCQTCPFRKEKQE